MITIRASMNVQKCRVFALLMVSAIAAGAQLPPLPETSEPKLPGGKSQRDEIVKADHEHSLKDADQLMKLSEELKIELEKNDRFIVSVSLLKKLEEIEKLAKRIRGRFKRL
jgi:hypothetical protein